jgi:hypothetical protein
MKTAIFIQINYFKNEHLILNLHTNKRFTINTTNLIDYLELHIFEEMKKRKFSNFTIFVLDLQEFQMFLKSLKFTCFSFKNILYRLKYKNLLSKKNEYLIFKDIAHFIPEIEKTTLIVSLTLLQTLITQIKLHFNIDITNPQILSLTSLGKSIYKKHSPNQYKLIKSLNEKEDKFIRQAFYGGRTEIIKPIIDNTYAYDINSLYAYIMAGNEFPFGYPKYVEHVELNNDFYGFVDVEVTSPSSMQYPLLPIRSTNLHSDMGVIYPIGTWRGIYFSEELKIAQRFGYKINRIFDGYSYKKIRLFDNFVYKLFNLRKEEKNSQLKSLYKKILNSLYGSFATIYENSKIIVTNEIHETISKKYENVGIAAAISAYGRLYLYNFVIKNNLDLFYWDTDGIIVREKLKHSVGENLGEFRLINKINKGICISTKFYIYSTTTKEYYYILRSISQKEYKLEWTTLYKLFLSQAQKLPSSTLEFSMNMSLYNIQFQRLDEISQIFHNKRKYFFKDKIIMTKPWFIKPIHID